MTPPRQAAARYPLLVVTFLLASIFFHMAPTIIPRGVFSSQAFGLEMNRQLAVATVN
jgi:hypothetical protein